MPNWLPHCGLYRKYLKTFTEIHYMWALEGITDCIYNYARW